METDQTFRFFLGTVTTEEFHRAVKSPWTFTITYEDLYGDTKKNTYIADFSQFLGETFDENWMKDISKHLDSIQKDINRFTKGYAKIQVVTQTREDFEKQRDKYLKEHENQALNNTETNTDDNN